MDYWCALWFWDVRDAADLPTVASEQFSEIINIDFGEDNPEINLVERPKPICATTIKPC